MRIAVWHNLPSGGGKRALYYHVRGLIERGHHVEVWCPDTADRDYLPLNAVAPEHVLPFPWPEGKSPWPLLRDMPPYVTARGRLRAMHKHCAQCAERIEEGNFDLLFANSCTFLGVPPIGRYVSMPKVLYLQEPYRRIYEAFPRPPWARPDLRGSDSFFRKLRSWAHHVVRVRNYLVQAREELLSAEAFDRILVNSQFSRESVLRAYGLESYVCHLGIDTTLFHPTGVPREGYVIGLGGVYFGKGCDRAIRAIAALPSGKRPDLVWVGNFADPPYQREMEELAASLGVGFRVHVRISDEELVDRLNRAALMVYTSRLEPFGFAPLEANACETPIVAIAEGGVRETVRDGVNGVLVKDADPENLAGAIAGLLDDPETARRMGVEARKAVEAQWRWDTAEEELEKHLLAAARSGNRCAGRKPQ